MVELVEALKELKDEGQVRDALKTYGYPAGHEKTQEQVDLWIKWTTKTVIKPVKVETQKSFSFKERTLKDAK